MNRFEAIAVSIGPTLTGVAALIVAMRTGRKVEHGLTKIEEVKREVTTGNAQTLAQLADRQESRRIEEIPAVERTAGEQNHIDTVGGST